MGRSPSAIAKNSNKHKKMTIVTKPTSALPTTSRVCETWTDQMTRSTKDLLHDDDDDDDDDENLYMSIICCRPPSLHRGRSFPALWKLKACSETVVLSSSSFVLPRHSNDNQKKKKANQNFSGGTSDNDDCDTTSGSTAGGDDDDEDDNDWLPLPQPSFASSHSIITSREDMEVRVEELRHRFRTYGRGTSQYDS